MRGMESRNGRVRSSLWLAVGSSLLLHAVVLFSDFADRDLPSGSPGATSTAPPRLLATLASPPPLTLLKPLKPTRRRASAPPSAAKKPAAASPRSREKSKLSAPTGAWATRSWSPAERAEMNKFLDELATEPKPPSGRQLAQRALSAARQMRSPEPDDGEDLTTQATTNGVDPYSLELYFDAFVRKMNRSAAFVSSDPHRRRGSRKALVEISLNADGSLKNYRVLRSGDQAMEIAYIKSVIDRASPFSAFPSDIRKASSSLSILMCILPPHSGGGGGFSRTSGGHDCRD